MSIETKQKLNVPAPIADVRENAFVGCCHIVGGVVVRLVDATPRDRAMVARQIGNPDGPASEAPDLTVRFVDRLIGDGPLRLLGQDVQIAGNAFLLDGSGHSMSSGGSSRVQIPFASLGQRSEIVCERGLKSIPLLVEMINLAALAKGILPLHASAFVFRGSTCLIIGCADGGKTGALLAFMAQGASFVGDDWCYWDVDQNSICGLPGPIRVRQVYLDQLPEYRSRISDRERRRMGCLRAGGTILNRFGSGPAFAESAFRRIRSAVERRQCVHVSPERLFSDSRQASASAPVRIFLLEKHQSPEVAVARLTPAEAARRIAFVLEEELSGLQTYYRKFCYAFPGASNAFLERISDLQRQRLCQATALAESFQVGHRHPSSLAATFAAMSKHF